jgi:hypothetical protein
MSESIPVVRIVAAIARALLQAAHVCKPDPSATAASIGILCPVASRAAGMPVTLCAMVR